MEQPQEILYWSLKEAELLEALGSQPGGLAGPEAEKRLKKFGENAIQSRRRTTALRLFLNQFKNPIVIHQVVVLLPTLVATTHTQKRLVLTKKKSNYT